MRIFIAHTSEDEPQAREICDGLKNIVQFQPYLAQDYPMPGENFKERIQNSIEDSAFFIVILSKNALSNQWVNQELGYACAIKKRKRGFQIIPISSSDLILKGFITRDSEDLILLEKYRGHEEIIADIIYTIRHGINALSDKKLRFTVKCKHCKDELNLPFKYAPFLPAHEVIYDSVVEMGYNSWSTECPNCKNENFTNIFTWGQMDT